MTNVLLIVLIAFSIVSVAIMVLLLRILDRTDKLMRDEMTALRKDLNEAARLYREEAAQLSKDLNEAARLQREEAARSMKDFKDSTLERMKTQYDDQKKHFDGFTNWLTGNSQAILKKLEEMRADSNNNARLTRDESAKSMGEFSKQLLDRLGEIFSSQNQRMDVFGKNLSEWMNANEKKVDSLRNQVENKLKEIQEVNTKKLDEMRVTVDEKLQGTLEKRLGESFKQVSERLEQVHKGLGEMQTLAVGVGDLKKVMTNVKTRGTWGEVTLGSILEQILSPEQYEANVSPNPNKREHVEYAIRLPGREDDKNVYLPVDAKFPVESYHRLLDAQDASDPERVASAVKQIENAIKLCAKDISTKYVCPPHTTDFGIMFLPSEGLFAEVIRRNGLVEYCQRECRVVISGPTTLTAVLNSLQMGFRTLAIEKRSSEVWEVLGAVKTEFGKFGEVLSNVKKKLGQASRTIENAEVRSRAMSRKLKSVESLPATEAKNILEMDDSISSYDAEDFDEE